jgi:hypothetical protein
MSAARLTAARLQRLAAELPNRYTLPLLHLSRARVLSGGQLDRLLRQPDTAPKAASRARQRAMTHLIGLGLVTRLDRRIGGVRAGSAGYVHVLTPAGYKLAAILTGQQLPGPVRRFRAPGPMFVAHALDIAEIYVQLTESSHARGFRVATFVTEPATWWPIGNGGHLRPDAYTALAVPTHRDVWWLEVDRDTESLPRLRDKFRDYLDHATYNGTGPDGAPPRVLFTTPSQERADAIRVAITNMANPDVAMFTVTTHKQAARLLVTELHTQTPEIRP